MAKENQQGYECGSCGYKPTEEELQQPNCPHCHMKRTSVVPLRAPKSTVMLNASGSLALTELFELADMDVDEDQGDTYFTNRCIRALKLLKKESEG